MFKVEHAAKCAQFWDISTCVWHVFCEIVIFVVDTRLSQLSDSARYFPPPLRKNNCNYSYKYNYNYN